MYEIKDKLILITGAGSGLGRQLAEDLASRGAIIAAVDLNPLGLDETVAHIRAAGGQVKEYIYDTAKQLPIAGLVGEVLDDWGRIDILVLAARVHPADPILTMDEWDFHRTLDVNLAGPFFLIQRVAQVMIEHGGGLIAVAVGAPAEGGAAYTASQAALATLIPVAAQEFAPHHIQVLAIDDFRLRIGEIDDF